MRGEDPVHKERENKRIFEVSVFKIKVVTLRIKLQSLRFQLKFWILRIGSELEFARVVSLSLRVSLAH